MIVDEISVIGRETFRHLDLALKAIKQNSSPFGGVSLLVVGELLTKKVCSGNQIRSHLGRGLLWKKLQLHELFEIFWQTSDSDFVQLLNGVQEGQQTDNDVI